MSEDSRSIPLEQRVNQLFATIIDADRNEVSSAVVANRISEELRRPVSAADIDALRRSGARRPQQDLLEKLAGYFDMPGSFLSDNPDDYYSTYLHLTLLITQRDKNIPFIALRPSSDHLGDASVQELTNYLGSIE
ncbi:hypothetical protein ABZ942_12665 [Nocardia sp. NPDC046473]|uniref:hypothetical protein n=1 Tax=Nocardia sp. NPDC046473 TaxID=3155733 RepID=UPI0033DAD3BC